jgi:hypothetical protein
MSSLIATLARRRPELLGNAGRKVFIRRRLRRAAAWRLRVPDRAPRSPARIASAVAVGAPAMAGGAALMYFLDPRQGHRRRSQAVQRAGALLRRSARRGKRAARHAASDAAGTVRRAAHPRLTQKPPPDDVTLARKVETEIFRPPDAPKSTVNVSAVSGVVELRGHVDSPEQVTQLERMARRVHGVRDVRNLLHLSGTPAPTDAGDRG